MKKAIAALTFLILIEGADHANSAMTDYETYAHKIREFIKENSTYI